LDEQRTCPQCGKAIGDVTGTCPHCGAVLEPASPASDAAASAVSDEGKCPHCGAELKPGDIICVQCGTNLLTGGRVVTKKRVKKAGRGRGALVAALIVVLVLAGVGVAVWYYRHDYAAEARRLFLENRLTEAADSYEKALRRNEEDPRLNFESALVALELQDYDKAAERFTRVINVEPTNTRAQLLLGVTYALSGDLIRELTALERAVAESPNAAAHFVLGLAYTIADRREEGLEQIRNAVNLEPNNAEYRRFAGAAYLGLGRYAEAIELLETALGQEPRNPQTRLLAGISYTAQGATDNAVTLLAAAAEAGIAYEASTRYYLGVAYALSGRYGDAVRELKESLRLQPGNPTAHLALGLTYSIEGRSQEALYEFEKIGDTMSFEAASSSAEAGRILIDQGEIGRAEQQIRKALEADPDNYMAHVAMGYLYSKQGDNAEAVREYREAVRLNPEGAAAHLFLAVHYANQKDFGEAARELEKYAQRSASPETRDTIGALAEQLKYSADL
jgi:tetratricopeptide (TPR) repeat protein